MTESEIEKRSDRVHAYNKLEDLIVQYNNATRLFGFDIFRADYKLNFSILCSFVVVGLYFVHCLGWAIVGAKRGDVNSILNSSACIITAFQHKFKIILIAFCWQEIYDIHEEILRLTKSSKGEVEEKFYRFNVSFEKFGKFIFVLYLMGAISLCATPLLSYFITGKIEQVFNVKFPYMENDTVVGYIVNLIGNVIVMSNTAIVFAACDNWSCYFFLFTGEYEELVERKISYMTKKVLESEKDGTLRNKGKLVDHHNMLVDCIKTSQDVEKFFSRMQFFELFCLGQIACISITLMTSIIAMKITGWHTLLVFIGDQLFQLFGYSLVGTLIETKYERLQTSIYNIPWFYLSISDQKMLMFFLQNSQKPKKFYLVGAQSMNVATGLAIIKSIYSSIILLDSLL